MRVRIADDTLSKFDFHDSIPEFFALLQEGIPLVINVEPDEFNFGDPDAKAGTLEQAVPAKDCLLMIAGDDERYNFIIGLSRNLGIVLSSLMMMMPEATIKEKLEGDELTEEDREVLFEIGNIIAGNADDFIHQQNDSFEPRIKIRELKDARDAEPSLDGVYYSTKLSISGKYDGDFFLFLDAEIVADVWGAELQPQQTEDVKEESSGDSSKPGVLLVQGPSPSEELDMESYVKDEFRVFRAPDIGSARDVLSKERIVLVLLDMQSESPGGISVTKWIKAITRSSRIPVVAFSNRPTKSVVISALKSGAVDFVVVPWDKERIVAKVRAAMDALEVKPMTM